MEWRCDGRDGGVSREWADFLASNSQCWVGGTYAEVWEENSKVTYEMSEGGVFNEAIWMEGVQGMVEVTVS